MKLLSLLSIFPLEFNEINKNFLTPIMFVLILSLESEVLKKVGRIHEFFDSRL